MNETADAYIDWKQWDDSTFGRFTPLDALYYTAETGLTAGNPVRVLEIGFGNGGFLGWAKSLGAEVFGVETNPQLNARARGFFGTDRFVASLEDATLTSGGNRFTHIVAFDVLEHIPQAELPAVLRRVRTLLAPDGRFVARFPNGDSPFGRINQHGDPTHVTTMGRGKLVYLARDAGLRLIEIRAPALPVEGVGLKRAVKRRLVGMGRYCIERALSVLYFGGQRVQLDPNYLAILGRDGPDD
jgi:SAM-dependent methyltransferase